MFLRINVHGIDTHLLIDTGAPLTIVSTALAEKIVSTTTPMLDPYNQAHA